VEVVLCAVHSCKVGCFRGLEACPRLKLASDGDIVVWPQLQSVLWWFGEREHPALLLVTHANVALLLVVNHRRYMLCCHCPGAGWGYLIIIDRLIIVEDC